MHIIRPATSADLAAINEIYNFYVETSPATFDTEPMSDGFEQSALNLHMGYKLDAWHAVASLQRHLWRD